MIHSSVIREEKVIIADSFPFFRQGLSDFLKEHHKLKNIVELNSGIEVINLLEKEPFHLVIADMRMAPCNGIETTAYIKEKYPKTKIIGMSPFDDEFYFLQMQRKGADGFLLKSTDKSEVSKAIEMILNGEKYFTNNFKHVFIQNTYYPFYHTISPNSHIQERYRQIIYLLCKNKKTDEISKLLNISDRTIDADRCKLNKLFNCSNGSAIIRYGFQIDILGDTLLKQKFESVLDSTIKMINEYNFK